MHKGNSDHQTSAQRISSSTSSQHAPATTLQELSSAYFFSGTNLSNPLANAQYEKEISDRVLDKLLSLQAKANKLTDVIIAIKRKPFPSNKQLLLLQLLEKEWKSVMDNCELMSNHMMILGNCIIERAKLRKAALDKEKEERARSRQEAVHVITTTLTSFGNIMTNLWGWITNPADQQQQSTAVDNNHLAYEPLQEHVDTKFIDANTKNLSKGLNGIAKDGGVYTSNIAGSGACET
ncbi:hypothetical protein HDU76_007984 [Blyttiomyces sp. JEL0837]|nr:hypothetical protein HDU76_007984 [Blyttiomyces sp. JEL0837]